MSAVSGGRRGGGVGLHRVESHTSLSEPVDYNLNFYFIFLSEPQVKEAS